MFFTFSPTPFISIKTYLGIAPTSCPNQVERNVKLIKWNCAQKSNSSIEGFYGKVNSIEKDYKNTGSTAICWHNVKVDSDDKKWIEAIFTDFRIPVVFI